MNVLVGWMNEIAVFPRNKNLRETERFPTLDTTLIYKQKWESHCHEQEEFPKKRNTYQNVRIKISFTKQMRLLS